MLKLVLTCAWLLLMGETTDETFVPKDISKAVALGCVVAGDKGPPPFVEVQVFVKSQIDNANWDYKPKVARYPIGRAGIYKALDECAAWYERVKAQMAKESDAKP